MFEGKERINVIKLREDYKLIHAVITVDEWCNQMITQWKGATREYSWFLLQQIMKPVYGFPGIKDGTNVLLITNRDAIPLDPLGQLDDEWKAENIASKQYPFKEIAKEQQFKAEAGNNSLLANSQLILAISAGIVILAAAIVGVLKYYGG